MITADKAREQYEKCADDRVEYRLNRVAGDGISRFITVERLSEKKQRELEDRGFRVKRNIFWNEYEISW